jgi:hypothetical protein
MPAGKNGIALVLQRGGEKLREELEVALTPLY